MSAAAGGAWRGAAPWTFPAARLPAAHVLALAAVACLAFHHALTIDVSFPLKLYEAALLAAGVAALGELRLRAAPGAYRIAAPLVGLLALSAVVLGVRLARPLESVDRYAAAVRFGPAGDGIAKLLYFALAVFALLVLSLAAHRDPRLYARVWTAGALAGAAYTWLLFLTSLLGVPPLLLPGIDRPQLIGLAGYTFIRSGTFEEGNFLGLYLLCSVAVAVYARRRLAAVVLGVTVLITFSTANVLGLALFLMGMGASHVRSKRGAVRRGLAVAALTAAAAAGVVTLAATGYAVEFVYAKLVTDEPGSKLDRLDTATAGVRMFVDNPLLGVGIGQYNYNYSAYQVTDIFARLRGDRSIANNVWVELLSELALAGTALFCAFLIAVFRRARGPELRPLRWGFVAALLVFNAFPSYLITFLWAYWALMIGAAPARARAESQA